jgi:hypothetical protein
MKHQHQQIRKSKRSHLAHPTRNMRLSSEERVRPKGSTNSLRSVYEIGPPSWVQKEMNYNSIAKHLVRIIIFPLIQVRNRIEAIKF